MRSVRLWLLFHVACSTPQLSDLNFKIKDELVNAKVAACWSFTDACHLVTVLETIH